MPPFSPRLTGLALVAVSLLISTVSLIAQPRPEIVATADAGVLGATGLSPDGDAVVFGVARVPGGYVTRVLHRAERLSADSLGELTAQVVPEEIAPAGSDELDPTSRALWVVVDLASGDYAVVSPDGSPARERPFSTTALGRGPSGLLDRLTQQLTGGHLLLVRPATPESPGGAWAQTLEDGSTFDLDDAVDGTFTAGLDLFQSVPSADGSGEPPPEEVAPGDLIFVVQPTTLEFSIVRFVGPEA